MSDEKRLLTKTDMARFLQRSISSIDKDVCARRIPYIRVGRCVRFDPTAVQDYLEANTIRPLGD